MTAAWSAAEAPTTAFYAARGRVLRQRNAGMDRVGLLKRILAGIGTLALTVGITSAVLGFWAIALSIQTSRYAGYLAPDYIPTRSETMELVEGSLGLAGAAAVAFFFVLIVRVRARGRAL